ncbi:MAG: TonB-dependent receptor [Deltaproteobacteria bacterium]|jgi:hemoglobin/transferrin/lactoferrin receptor protein|nr:TonB-dependent receptor [Deltaproteobacteria bacterium]
MVFLGKVLATLFGRAYEDKQRPTRRSLGTKSTYLNFLVLFLTLSLLLGATAKAQTEDEIKVRSIMVTANRVLEDLFYIPMSVSVVTAEDIEKQPYTSIYDILATVPGITIEQASSATSSTGMAGASRVSMRGDAYGRTLILINGVKSMDKEKGYGFVTITPSQIERIEVIKGPASVLYGSEALGGVISIITKKGGDKPVGFSQNVVLDSSTESADLTTALFGDYKGFTYRFAGNGVNVKDRKVPKGSRDRSGTLMQSNSARSHYRNRYYTGQLGYHWDNYSLNVQYDKYENITFWAQGESSRDSSTLMYFPKNDRDTWIGTFTATDIGALSKLTLTGSYQHAERLWHNEMYMVGYHLISDLSNDIHQYNGSIQTEWSLGNHRLTVGADYYRDEIDLISDNDVPYIPPMGLFGPTAGTASVKQTNLGLFAQDEWKFQDNWRVTFGLRQTWFDGKVSGLTGNYYDNVTHKTRKYSDLVGSLGFVYTGIQDLALRALVAQGTRYPTASQLFTGTTGHFVSYAFSVPNPNLKPEKSINYELGARYITANWDLDLSLFYSKAKDYIDRYTVNNQQYWFNASKAETRGAELSVAYSFIDVGLTPYTKITYIRREFTDFNGLKTHASGNSPLKGRIGLKFDKTINESNNFYSDIYVDWALKAKDRVNSDIMMGMQLTAQREHEAWQTLCLTLGLRGGVNHKYNVSLSVRNILNQKYTVANGSTNMPEAATHVVLGMGFEY